MLFVIDVTCFLNKKFMNFVINYLKTELLKFDGSY